MENFESNYPRPNQFKAYLVKPEWFKKCCFWFRLFALAVAAAIIYCTVTFATNQGDWTGSDGLIWLGYAVMGLAFSFLAWSQYAMVTLCLLRQVNPRIKPEALSFLACLLPLTLYFPMYAVLDFIVIRLGSGVVPTISPKKPISASISVFACFVLLLAGLGCAAIYAALNMALLAIASGVLTLLGLVVLVIIVQDATKAMVVILEDIRRQLVPPPVMSHAHYPDDQVFDESRAGFHHNEEI